MKLTIEHEGITATVQEDVLKVDSILELFAGLLVAAHFQPDSITQAMGEYYVVHGPQEEDEG